MDTFNYEVQDMLDIGVDRAWCGPFPRETLAARDDVGALIRLKVISQCVLSKFFHIL